MKVEKQVSFTPGPWTFDGKGEWTRIKSRGEWTIAEVNRDYVVSTQEEVANAKLIAAAPKLLVALQMALVELRGAYSLTEWNSARAKQIADMNIRNIEGAIKAATE